MLFDVARLLWMPDWLVLCDLSSKNFSGGFFLTPAPSSALCGWAGVASFPDNAMFLERRTLLVTAACCPVFASNCGLTYEVAFEPRGCDTTSLTVVR